MRSGQTHQRISYDPEALHIAQIPADRTRRSFLFPLTIVHLLGQCIIIQGPEGALGCTDIHAWRGWDGAQLSQFFFTVIIPRSG
jgi:hypothetical protein